MLGKEFSLSLEVKITSFSGSGLSNILHFSQEGPAVFLNHDNGNKIREVWKSGPWYLFYNHITL